MKRFRWIVLAIVIALIGVPVGAQVTTSLGGLPGIVVGVCTQYFPYAGGACASLAVYNLTPGAVSTAITTAGNASIQQASTTAVWDDPPVNSTAFFCPGGLSSSNVLPMAGSYNFSTTTVTSAVAVDTALTTNGHDLPSCFGLGNGYIGVSTHPYAAYSSGTACLTAGTGAPGSGLKCMNLVVGNTIGGGVTNADLSATGSRHAIPLVGVSEVSGSRWGNTTRACGQEQYAISAAVQGGFFSCFTFNDSLPSGLTIDTGISGDGAVGSYSVLSDTITTAKQATEVFSNQPLSDGAFLATASTDNSGHSVTITETIPAAGAFGGATCAITFSTTGVVATDVGTIVSDFASGGTGTGCSSVPTYYSHHQTTDSTLCIGSSAKCWVLDLKAGVPAMLGTSNVTSSDATNFPIAYTHFGGTGLVESFAFGRIVNAYGTWYELTNIESLDSYVSGSANNGNSSGLAYTLVSDGAGPTAGVWNTCDFTRTDCFSTSPITTMNHSLSSVTTPTSYKFGGGAMGSLGSNCDNAQCSNIINEPTSLTTYRAVPEVITNAPTGHDCSGCTHSRNPFIFDLSMGAAVSTACSPAFAAFYFTTDNPLTTGYLLFQGSDSTCTQQWYLAKISATTGKTTDIYCVECSATASQNGFGRISWSATSGLHVLISSGNGGAAFSGCTGGGCLIEDTSTNGGSTWTRTVTHNYGGTNTAANVCSGVTVQDNTRMMALCEPGAQTSGSATYDLFDALTL